MKHPLLSRSRLSLAFAGLLLACQGTWAEMPEAPVTAALQSFEAAQRGDSGAVKSAIEQFQSLLRADAGNPLLQAYLGAATTMKARDALMPWNKMAAAEDGLAQIDKALALLGPAHDQQRYRGTPLSLQTRLVAANTFIALPAMFKRAPRGKVLLEDIQASPLYASCPPGFQGAVLMSSARQATEAGDAARARSLYEQVVAQALPQRPQAEVALKELTR